ncbi:hypothetical protein CYMTET_31038 [Cymbomonas tetramitiformis]|uniref:Uncharacterized protein n=1 Tax=Cymbomonas tetramitiformis TaxID=36881 RepID=A0AAE0FJ52_9CHLO|nr:hypothetical protein CYMTET_31038 [Cymbomonas tetramitiformis]
MQGACRVQSSSTPTQTQPRLPSQNFTPRQWLLQTPECTRRRRTWGPFDLKPAVNSEGLEQSYPMSPVTLAPMSGITDSAFRQICSSVLECERPLIFLERYTPSSGLLAGVKAQKENSSGKEDEARVVTSQLRRRSTRRLGLVPLRWRWNCGCTNYGGAAETAGALRLPGSGDASRDGEGTAVAGIKGRDGQLT